MEEIFVMKFGHRLMILDQVLSNDYGHCYKIALARRLQKCGLYSAMFIKSCFDLVVMSSMHQFIPIR